MEQINLLEYIQWLVTTNVFTLAKEGKGLVDHKAHFIIGFIEEYFEWLNAEPEDELKEISDMLAYYCLALVSLGFSPVFVIEQLNSSEDLLIKSAMQKVTGAGKRILRGDEGAELEFAKETAIVLRQLVQTVETDNDCPALSFETVAAINKSKLTSRLKNTGTFKGQGNR